MLENETICTSFIEPVVIVVIHRSCHTEVSDLHGLAGVNEAVATCQITKNTALLTGHFHTGNSDTVRE